MGKRNVLEAGGGGAHTERDSKRAKREPQHEHAPQRVNDLAKAVASARDLQKALVFDQGATGDFRSGLNLLKNFLDSILYSTDEDDLPRKRAILREYLETQKGQGKHEREVIFLQNITQAWDFAAETNFEAILAQVTAVLALLLKVLASHADFLDYGTLLAKAILQPSVARRLVRSTSAATNKEHIISPALRLLTELTKFNEGAHARAVYAKRDFTLEPKILARNLGLRKQQSLEDHQQRPSIRTVALRYLLTHLRYQDERAKSEILSNTNIIRPIFYQLETDPPFLIFETFDVFTNHVFKDKTLTRSTKSRILSGPTLSRIANLYTYTLNEGDLAEGQKAPSDIAHGFLRMVCTDPAYGVVLPTHGFYPSSLEDDEDAEDNTQNLLEQDIDTVENYSKTSSVRNVILSEFIQKLKPYANTLHQELILDIFRACPELIANYFSNSRDFGYDPKLTSTWIGYSAFLYQSVSLPLPRFFGLKKTYRTHPPPVSVLMQSILPQPLNQQVLTKCINQNSHLIELFAIRLNIVAIHKLRVVLEELKTASSMRPSKQWEQAAKRLVSETTRRCPTIRTLFLALKKPGMKDLKRESLTRLIRLYYEVLPQAALQEKFDVSLPLCNALAEVENQPSVSNTAAFRVMELEHWIQMARHSTAMRWWQKQKSLQLSPFVTLLKLLNTSNSSEQYAGLRQLLVTILRDQEILQSKTSPSGLDALIASLTMPHGSTVSINAVLEFLDDCCIRFMSASVKYFDDLDALGTQNSSLKVNRPRSFSPILLTFVEQWPFRGGLSATADGGEHIAQWLSRLLYLLKLVGEDESALGFVRDALLEAAAPPYKDVIKDAFLWKMGKEKAKEALKLATGADFSGSERSTFSPAPVHLMESVKSTKVKPCIDLEAPPGEDERHTGLTRWRKKELVEAIEDGDIGELLLCLCSKHLEIRLQAQRGIHQLMAIIATSGINDNQKNFSEANQVKKMDQDLEQTYLLLGEVLETVDATGKELFPYLGGVLAARSLKILMDPTHSLFSKINNFLTKAPSWNIHSLIRTLWNSVIATEPDVDDTYHAGVEWYLDYLLESLRTTEDMEIFRKSNIFEQLFGHYLARSCSTSAKDKIIRLLLRATHVGGSTTLITRCGIVPWLQMVLGNNDPRHRALRTLAARVGETCDKHRVAEWSSGSIGGMIASLTKVDA